MTNVRRPIHLQLRPAATGSLGALQTGGHSRRLTPPTSCNPKQALSPTAAGSLPSQILPHLFVGAQDQTNRETVNRLNIKYILSLGLLPLVLQQQQAPGSPPPLPSQNCSRDFKVRIRTNTPSSTPTPTGHSPFAPLGGQSVSEQQQIASSPQQQQSAQRADNENKGVKQARSIHCKCINVADNSEQMLMKFFDEAYAFIEEARRKKCNILVHCSAGISRSPTIAIAYLMRVKAMHWKDAYELVKQCRPQIDPNLSFMGQLRLYSKSLRDDQHQQQQQQPQQQQQQTPTLEQHLLTNIGVVSGISANLASQNQLGGGGGDFSDKIEATDKIDRLPRSLNTHLSHHNHQHHHHHYHNLELP